MNKMITEQDFEKVKNHVSEALKVFEPICYEGGDYGSIEWNEKYEKIKEWRFLHYELALDVLLYDFLKNDIIGTFKVAKILKEWCKNSSEYKDKFKEKIVFNEVFEIELLKAVRGDLGISKEVFVSAYKKYLIQEDDFLIFKMYIIRFRGLVELYSKLVSKNKREKLCGAIIDINVINELIIIEKELLQIQRERLFAK